MRRHASQCASRKRRGSVSEGPPQGPPLPPPSLDAPVRGTRFHRLAVRYLCRFQCYAVAIARAEPPRAHLRRSSRAWPGTRGLSGSQGAHFSFPRYPPGKTYQLTRLPRVPFLQALPAPELVGQVFCGVGCDRWCLVVLICGSLVAGEQERLLVASSVHRTSPWPRL